MLKIAFCVDNRGIAGIDCTKINEFNPGIGGTPYMFYLLSYYLSRYYKDKIQVVLLLYNKQNIPDEIVSVKVDNVYAAADYCSKNKFDVLVVRTMDDLQFYKYIKLKEINVVLWSHNFITDYRTLREISKNKFIIKNVFVGKEQLEYYIDDDIYNKSIYIYNLFNYESYNINVLETKVKDKEVTYIGSLTPEKGFHILAKQWKKILKEVPDAKLNVIGGGNLYNREEIIDSLMSAKKEYEKTILKYITDEKGQILESVKFYGILGQEKNNILRRTKIGVSNPSGKTETFGITALEFQASGIPVVTKKCCGYLDTVSHNETGYLCRNGYQIRKKIIDLLLDDVLNQRLATGGLIFVRNKFLIKNTCERWIELFEQILNNSSEQQVESINNLLFELKVFKILIRNIRKVIKIPSYTYVKLLQKKILKKILY